MFERDQAAGLRQLFARESLRVIVLGGACAEKSSVAARLAIGLANQDRNVMIMDGSAGALSVYWGLPSRYELAHVISGDKRIEQVMLNAPRGVTVLPAARGLGRLDGLTESEARRVRDAFAHLSRPVDTLIVNAAPFQAERAFKIFQGKATILMVVSEVASSITAAYGEMKALKQGAGVTEFDLMIGAARSEYGATQIYANMAEAAQRYLSVRLNYCASGAGFIYSNSRLHVRGQSRICDAQRTIRTPALPGPALAPVHEVENR